jgi:ABC-type antimicrobial peptide transport system permease subunit
MLDRYVNARIHKSLLVLWGAVGLVLLIACANLSGLLLARTAARSKEIAVRLAIGADRTRITRMFVAQGAVVLAAGLLLGLGGAIALGRILRSQLFGVQPADPVVLAGMTLAFALCGLAAIAWPSRAAGLVDSVAALKD